MISRILCRLRYPFYVLLFLSASNLSSQNNCIKFDIIGGTAPKGDCIWVPILVYNFDSLIGFQFGITYDPQVIMPVDKWTNDKLPGFDISDINFELATKLVKVVWTDPIGFCTSSLTDNDTLIMIKFKLVGEPGTCTSINFTPDNIFTTEFLDCNVNEYCLEEINPQDNDICIGQPVDLCVISYSCGTLTNTGTITIKPFGGSPPYTVEWLSPPGAIDILNNSGDSKTYTNLFPGSYQVKVTDMTGKDTILDISIGFANPIVIIPNGITQPKCWNESNGVIDIRITGGSGDLTIGWRPLNIYGETRLSNLSVGTYFVTVMDTSGCIATDSFTLFADTMVANVEIVADASCTNDGKVIARATGGDPCPPNNSYCFMWSQHVAANNCDSVSHNDSLSGKQFVIVKDCRGCADTVDFEVLFTGELLDSLLIDPIKCYNTTGSFQSFISSKTGNLNIPVSFHLTDSSGNTVFGGANGVDTYRSPQLRRGCYYLDITDNAGCMRRDTICFKEPDSLEIMDLALDTTETCTPGNDGFLAVDGKGGTPTYNFLWSNMMMGGSITNLNQGNYSVTVTDFNGCTASKSFSITRPNGPVIDNFTIVNPLCQGDLTGSVQVNFTTGSAVVTQFNWNVPGSTNKISNLPAGNYSVTIIDANGCSDSDTVSIIPSGGLSIASTNIRQPECNRSSNGFITITLPNNAPPGVTYQWSNNNQTSVNANLQAGIYCVTIDDPGTCPAIDTCFELFDPPKINIQVDNLLSPTCSTPGTCDAFATALAQGRDSLYQFIWSSGQSSRKDTLRNDTVRNLCAGDQFLIVVNGNCQDTILFNVPEAVPITIDTPSIYIVPPSCYNSNDGVISLQAKGGTGPYRYEWIVPAIISDTIRNLGDGTYFVNIIDAKNCVHLDSVRLRQPDSIRVDIILGSTLDVTCPGKSDGRITTAWTGGNKGKGSFQWVPPINPPDSIATNLGQGRYTLFVTDINGCTGSNEYTILAPPALTMQLTPIDTPKCEDDQIQFSVLQANGGTGPAYRFTINNGAPNNIGDFVSLFSGNYTIRLYDKNNCFLDTTINILNPTNSLSLDFGRDFDTIQLGDSILLDGKLSSTAVIDSVIWNPSGSVRNPSSTISYVSPSRNTQFLLTVIDENGCSTSDLITIIVRNTRKFYAPTIFSPNGDQINDFFTLHIGQGITAIKSLLIFDRWGNQVYGIENPALNGETLDTWNGRAGNSGEIMNPAVFVYLAEVVFQDGSTIVYRGDLTLLR